MRKLLSLLVVLAAIGFCPKPAQADSVCMGPTSSATVAITASTQLIATSGVTLIYACSLAGSIAGTSPTYQFVYGTGAVCATGLTTLTGVIALNSGTSISLGQSDATKFTVPVGSNLCVIMGGTTPSMQGLFTYVQR